MPGPLDQLLQVPKDQFLCKENLPNIEESVNSGCRVTRPMPWRLNMSHTNAELFK